MPQDAICVIGLGHIGLPLAVLFASRGHRVIGVDINPKVVAAVNQGRIAMNEPGLDVLVREVVAAGYLTADRTPCEADAYIIAVPTPITPAKKADMRQVIAAAESILPHLRTGNTVILESTSPTGTINELLLPILNRSGLRLGEELFVGYSPGRVSPGRILQEMVDNDRIVGGVNRASARRISRLYRSFVKGEIYLTDATTVEMCKLMENAYRDVNIALANELAKICEDLGISAREAINLCNKHPRVGIHQPGPGVGGYCLDPWFIVEKQPKLARIIRLARETNDGMPVHVVQAVDHILSPVAGRKKVTILGVTCNPDVGDLWESPSFGLANLFDKLGYEVRLYDPHVNGLPRQASSPVDAAEASDMLVLAVNHSAFARLPLAEMGGRMRHKIVFDTRGFLDRAEMERLGFIYYALGERGGRSHVCDAAPDTMSTAAVAGN